MITNSALHYLPIRKTIGARHIVATFFLTATVFIYVGQIYYAARHECVNYGLPIDNKFVGE